MSKRLLNCLLFLSADNLGAAGSAAAPAQSAAPAAPAAAAPEAPAAPAQPAAAVAKPGIFAKAGEFIAARADLLQKISAHETTITDLRGQLSTAQGTITTQLAELTELRAGKASLEAAVAGLETSAKSAEEQAIDIAASQGVPPKQLAAVSAEAKTAEELRADWNAIKDPTARAAFYAKHKDQLLTA